MQPWGVQRPRRVCLLGQEQLAVRVFWGGQVQDKSQGKSPGQSCSQSASCQGDLQGFWNPGDPTREHQAFLSTDPSELWGPSDHLSEEVAQSGLEHMDDKDSGKEKSNPHAANSLQEPFQLQFHAGGRRDNNGKLFKTSVRHYSSELCELSGKHTVFRESAAEVEHELPRADADEGHNQEDTGDED